MTKKEIVKKISEEKGLTQLAVKEIVQMTFDAIVETLIEDPKHRIELRNFGVFEVKKRAARTARNPRTGDAVEVPAKFVVTFKPGKEMEEKVLELERAEAARELGAKPDTQGREPVIPPSVSPADASRPETSFPPQINTQPDVPPSGGPIGNGQYGGLPATPRQEDSWSDRPGGQS